MRFHLILLAIMTPVFMIAQVPDFVPEDGLVAWYPFNGNANDESGNGHDGVVHNLTITPDRFNNPGAAFLWPSNSNGSNYIDIGNLSPEVPESITISIWFYADGGFIEPRLISRGEGGILTKTTSNSDRQYYINWCGACFCPLEHSISSLEWHHLVFSSNCQNEARLYVDGELIQNLTLEGGDLDVSIFGDWNIGRKAIAAYDAWGGMIDDVGIWNRSLTEAEVASLFNAELVIEGCTDPFACNYDIETDSDDGSCLYADNCGVCGGDNTTCTGCMDTTACNFDESALVEGECIYPIMGEDCGAGAVACGEGQIWIPETQQCLTISLFDSDFDGCVTGSDLLDFLSAFGYCLDTVD